jgi:hypothetical protein
LNRNEHDSLELAVIATRAGSTDAPSAAYAAATAARATASPSGAGS